MKLILRKAPLFIAMLMLLGSAGVGAEESAQPATGTAARGNPLSLKNLEASIF